MADGYQPLTELAKARTVERFDEAGLLGPFKGEIERDLNNVERFAGVLEDFVPRQ